MERCGSGRSSVADLSMRLAVLGGHHPLVYNEGVEWSLVEDVGVLRLGTGEGMGPIGDRSVSVGRARFGLEASGVAPLDCPVSVTTFVRALVRGTMETAIRGLDWRRWPARAIWTEHVGWVSTQRFVRWWSIHRLATLRAVWT